MRASDLVAWLRAHGCTLRAEDGGLKLDAPRGLLDDDDVACIQEHKAELLALLAANPGGCARLRPLPWLAALGRWADEGQHGWRQRWGQRTAELEAKGLRWFEAEERAFLEVAEERDQVGGVDPPDSIATQPAGPTQEPHRARGARGRPQGGRLLAGFTAGPQDSTREARPA
jgi:hypothetical protein